MDTQRQKRSLLRVIPKKRNVNIAADTSPQNNSKDVRQIDYKEESGFWGE